MQLTGQLLGCVSIQVWRRKTILVGSMMSLGVLVVLCLYYNSAVRAVETQVRILPQQHNVQFLVEHPSPPTVQIEHLSHSHVHQSNGPNLGGMAPELSLDGGSETRANFGNYPGNLYAGSRSSKPYVPQQRLVHLDLKGAPPKVKYLKDLFPLFKDLGATGLLLEWEDMFPFTGQLASLAATNAYTVDEVTTILKLASENDLEVIPLVQTFGHVEFALKLEQFARLREVMHLHKDARFLHIGCDEVFHMGECSRCRQKLRDDLFLMHVSSVAKYVRSKYPKVTPIIWDDMLRQLSTSSLESYNIGQLVEPMVWVYAEDIYRFVPGPVWDKYATIFPTVWTASAFKGAFGETLYVPNVQRHLDNNLHWLDLMRAESSKFKAGFRGIVITGWQRYDHFAVLCELLPSGIPSLAVNLLATSHGYFNSSLQPKLTSALKCGIYSYNTVGGMHNFVNLNSDPFLWDQFSRCMFPGHLFFKLTYKLNMVEKDVQDLIQTTRATRGWLTEYNVRHNFSSPLRLDELMLDEPRIYHSVTSLVQSAQDALANIFDKYTIAEWIEQKVYPLIKELEKLEGDSYRLKQIKTWPRRPFPILDDLKRLGLNLVDENDSKVSRK
ncbi:unnamed protein product [Bemisia tabaci]|uniref:Beta-N-acetylhexosaminidase n=1 Tax=Bemisia tabaci TaxID=7038 RepID=A0A9P0A8L6_BEMTA|nr:unnamed protein product [Bemisia tabaci]